MDDLVKSFKAQLYDRVSSPLLSSFVLAWIVWNHRLFMVLLSSDLKIFEKFIYVDSILYPTWREIAGPGFIWPLMSALALLFLYPIPGRWVYEYVRKEQRELKRIQQRIDDETPLTVESARALRTEMRLIQEEIDSKDSQISTLRASIQSLEEERDRNLRSGQSLFEGLELSSRQKNILAMVAAHPETQVSLYQHLSSASHVVVARDVDYLVEQDLLVETSSGADPRVMVSTKGRRYLVERAPDLSQRFVGKPFDELSID